MTIRLLKCMQKDWREYMRNRRNIVFSFILFLLACMVLCTTRVIPALIEELVKRSPGMISDPTSIASNLSSLFPQDLKSSMGIWASDVGVFYSIAIVLIVHNLLPREIQAGKWIFPSKVGYSYTIAMLSKGFVYGLGSALPVVVFYNLYYCIGSLFLIQNYTFQNALQNSVVLGISLFFIANLTITCSLMHKRSIFSALSILLIVMVAPDVLTLFTFGKYFPTYFLTYVYSSGSDLTKLIIPLLSMIPIYTVLVVLAIRRAARIELSH